MKIYLIIGILVTMVTCWTNMTDEKDNKFKSMFYTLRNYQIDREWINVLLDFIMVMFVIIYLWPIMIIKVIIDPE